MERVLPSKVEAVLLFDDYRGFGPRELLALLNEVSTEFGYNFKRTHHENSPSYLNYFSDGLMVEVSHSDVSLAPDGFSAVLESGFTSLTFPDAEAQVSSHQKYVFVAITHCGFSHDDPEGHMPPKTPTGPMSGEQFDFAIGLLKNLSLAYSSRSIPKAIHWLQSNKLLTLKQFATLALEPKDISLLIHPSLFSSGEDENGVQMVGLRTYGAVCLIGKEILFEEAPVTPDVLFDRVLQFITRAMGTGWFIPDGDTFGLDEHETIRVRHIEDEHDEQGVVQLEFERSEELGFDFTSQESEEEEDKVEVDPDDPVEKALQERLEQMKAGEGEADDEGEEEPPQKQVEPWQSSAKKPDIKALRALTQIAPQKEKTSFWSQQPEEKKQQAPESPALSAGNIEETVSSVEVVSDIEALQEMQTVGVEEEKPSRLLKKVSGLFAKK